MNSPTRTIRQRITRGAAALLGVVGLGAVALLAQAPAVAHAASDGSGTIQCFNPAVPTQTQVGHNYGPDCGANPSGNAPYVTIPSQSASVCNAFKYTVEGSTPPEVEYLVHMDAPGTCVMDLTYGSDPEVTISTQVVPAGTSTPTYPSGVQAAQGCDIMPTGTVVGLASSQNGGYWIADAAGQVDACGLGASTTYGELSSAPSSPVVGIVATPDAKGYWLVGRNGAVYAFGDAGSYGSVPGLPASEQPGVPVVGMAATANGKGYWVVTSGGDIYSFGNAAFHGSTGAITLNKPIVGMALDPNTGGYWLDASDGGVFAFDAPFYGSMGGTVLNKPVVGMAPDLATGGYWLVAADGGVFSFHAPFHGSTGHLALSKPIVGMEANASGSGYRFVATDGGVFDFGSSRFYGSAM